MIIRNDDPAYDTNLDNYKTFCEICDKYGVQIIQAVVPIGRTIPIQKSMTDTQIIGLGGRSLLLDNVELMNYMRSRKDKDYFAVHGLWHTHEPTESEIIASMSILELWGLEATYFVPPFNEGSYPDTIAGLTFCGQNDCLESYMDGYRYQNDIPTTKIVYLHSWRFGHQINERPGVCYTYEQLSNCLNRLKEAGVI